MMEIQDRIWVSHDPRRAATPFREGVRRALSVAFPPHEDELPKRMETALHVLTLALTAANQP